MLRLELAQHIDRILCDHILEAGFNRSGLLRAIADRLGVDTNSRSTPLLIRLQKYLLQLTGATNSLYPVLIVDDAQLLERESMMDLCALMVSADKKTGFLNRYKHRLKMYMGWVQRSRHGILCSFTTAFL